MMQAPLEPLFWPTARPCYPFVNVMSRRMILGLVVSCSFQVSPPFVVRMISEGYRLLSSGAQTTQPWV
jgi:hypothetical protein